MRRIIIAVLALALASGLVGEATTDHRPVAHAGGGWPIKIFAVSTPSRLLGAALSNRYVSGISVRYSWARIEPRPGQYRWGIIDDTLRRARGAGKLAMIRVLAGIYTPDWLKRRTPTLTFADEDLYNPAAYPDTVTMPIPWKRTYRQRLERFVKALGRRYNGARGLYSVQMTGGGFIGEMTLPTDREKWRRAGYTDRKYARTWKHIISYYRHAFPHTPINLDIVEPWGVSGQSHVVDPVVRFALRKDRKKAWIQSNALRPDMLGWIGPYRQVIRESSRRTRVGYQMIGHAATTQALKDCFTVAVQDHVSYVEVYGNDVLSSANQTALRYLATAGRG